jgi:exo-1,4-beta-D-glucosaminidase
MNRLTLPCFFALLAMPAVLSCETRTPLHDGWRLQSACKLNADGAAISAAGFPVADWIETTVPSTVLAAQVAAGVVPDPYFGDNLRKLPGAGYPIGPSYANEPMVANSPYRCGWWYRKEFTAPAATSAGQHFWLHFGGINYRADVWLNGKEIADSADVAGAYRLYDLDAAAAIKPGQKNVLAVETYAPTEFDLGINWVDWNPAPPDKDMGLWGDVDLVTTGAVALRSPMVVTHFEDNSLGVADLTVYADLQNASDRVVNGEVSGSAAGATFTQTVTLAAHEDRTVVFTPQEFPQLRIHNPHIWWPWQMGQPNLEQLTMRFAVKEQVEDAQSVQFGIREVTTELTAVNGSRLFLVNGKRILIRGGGWAQDMMLRPGPTRLREQFRMVRDMHLNAIRLEGKLDTDEFFRLADRQGILILAGWCCCDHWERWETWKPRDLEIATASLRSQMLRLRSHPSLLVWLNGSDHAPPPNVERAYLDVEAQTHWPNPVLAAASANDTPGSGPTGVKMTGPYDYVEPSYWYVDRTHGGAFGFNTETSPGPAIPSLASRKKFLSDPEAWPPTADWILHEGGGEFASLKAFDSAMAAIYAKPTSVADYERMAQTMSYDSERAMFEAYSRNKYVSTGVVQWMLNNAWPSLIWHLYDYYLDAGGGYFGAKKACEPMHIQYSYDDRSIVVVNSTYSRVRGLHASVQVHGIKWNDLYDAQATVDAGADSAQRVFEIPDTLYASGERIFFIDLKLADSAGHLLSRNFYWVPGTLTTFDWEKTWYTLTPAERYEDLNALTHLPEATVTAHAEIADSPQGRVLRLHLDNASAALAFQLHAAVRTPDGGLIAPVFWSDNWLELVPGESTTLTAQLPKDYGGAPVVQIEGWNAPLATIVPAAAPAAHK